jgi:hypothetical protein
MKEIQETIDFLELHFKAEKGMPFGKQKWDAWQKLKEFILPKECPKWKSCVMTAVLTGNFIDCKNCVDNPKKT